MRKFSLLLLLVVFSASVAAQMPTNGDYANWDWSNQNQNNWKMKQGNAWVDISPPFFWNTDKSPHLDEIYRMKDYTFENGWRLVHANFDGTYPYFILYNIYKSVLRSYIYTGSTVNYSGILAVLTPSEKLKESKILNSSVTYQYAIDDKQKLNIQNIAVLDTHTGLASWSVADFLMSFDSNIKSTDFKDQKWNIAFYTSNQMDVKLNITGTSTPVPVDKLTTFVGSQGSISSSGFYTQYSRVNKLVQSGDDYFSNMQKSADKIKTDAWKPLVNYKNTVNSLAKVGGYLNALASLSSGIGVVASFADIFMGGLGSQSTPMGYVHNLEATGTITFQQKMRDTQFQVPGVEYSYNARPSWAFQCPMGVINLKTTPVIKKTTSYMRVNDAYYNYDMKMLVENYFQSSKDLCTPVYPKFYDVFSREEAARHSFVKYSFDEGINIINQNIPGVSIVDVKAAIVCKANNGTGINKEYSIVSKAYGSTQLISKYNNRPVDIRIENPIYNYLASEKFIIHKYGESNRDIYFGTPYAHINALKKVIFEVPSNTDVLLGLLVTYRIPNNPEPQIYKALYRFNEKQENASKPLIFFFESQPNFGTSEGTLLKSTISVLDFGCSTTKSGLRSTLLIDSNEKFEVNLYPNPTNGILNITLPDSCNKADLNIYNMQGKLVLSQSIDGFSSTIDMSGCPKGTYIVTLLSENSSYQNKIILK